MKYFLRRIDLGIYEACMHFSHKLQRTTGYTNYSIARAGRFVCVAATLVIASNPLMHFLTEDDSGVRWLLWCTAALCLYYFVRDIETLNRFERHFMSGNPTMPIELFVHIVAGMYFRLIWVCWTALQLGIFLGSIREYRHPFFQFIGCPGFFGGALVYYYFLIVVPLPPRTSKVAEWLKALRAALVPARATQ